VNLRTREHSNFPFPHSPKIFRHSSINKGRKSPIDGALRHRKKNTTLMSKVLNSHTTRTTIRVIALVIMLFVLVNIFA
jgi:hypothetical protein